MRLLLDGLGKLGRRLATWVTFGLLAGLMLLVFLAIGASANDLTGQPDSGAIRALLTFPQAYDAVLAFIVGFGGLLAVIYGAAVAGSEWSWGTIKNAVARGESRVVYVLSTFGSIAVVLGVGLLFAVVVGVGAAVGGASLAGIPTGGIADGNALMALPEKIGRSWVAIVSSAGIGFAIATFTRSQLAGIGAGIATYFGEQFSSIFFPEIVRWLPFSAAEASTSLGASGGITVGGTGANGSPVVALAPDLALIVVLLWLVGALAASALATERAEITG